MNQNRRHINTQSIRRFIFPSGRCQPQHAKAYTDKRRIDAAADSPFSFTIIYESDDLVLFTNP